MSRLDEIREHSTGDGRAVTFPLVNEAEPAAVAVRVDGQPVAATVHPLRYEVTLALAPPAGADVEIRYIPARS